MRGNSLQRRLVDIGTVLTAVILVLVPFHAFLTVWLNSLTGHYTLLRLWEEYLLVVLAVIAGWLLLRDRALRQTFRKSTLMHLILVYGVIQLLWAAVVYARHDATTKALAYGLLVNLRFLVFFAAVRVLAGTSRRLRTEWRRLAIGPALAVIIIGLLQYFVLPYDVLRHFGYSQATIYPYETINHNIRYIRVMSTLRGANPLGAYLVLILSLVLVLWRKRLRDWRFAILPLAGLLVLVLTFSRGAWLGFVAAALIAGATLLRTGRLRRIAAAGMVAVIVIGLGLALALRHNPTFENVFTHTQDHSAVAATSNEGHRSALRTGVHDVLHEPFGRGPGTAGPASVYNDGKARIAENYFVQIGQETGWAGLLVFILINLYLGRELWRRRQEPLALGLFAALVGVSIVNMLSHAWTDDTLAYLFWGLAGIALGNGAQSGEDRRRGTLSSIQAVKKPVRKTKVAV